VASGVHLNRIHVNNIKIQKAKEGQVLEQLAPQTTRANYKHPNHAVQHLLGIIARHKQGAGARACMS
jgi:hypothetical protein